MKGSIRQKDPESQGTEQILGSVLASGNLLGISSVCPGLQRVTGALGRELSTTGETVGYGQVMYHKDKEKNTKQSGNKNCLIHSRPVKDIIVTKIAITRPDQDIAVTNNTTFHTCRG